MTDAVLELLPLGFPWTTFDPFLFCVHHDDRYPKGNAQFGPEASLRGRRIGNDFDGIDGWRMYHGDVVPGFPQHPHRGFETVTIVRQGYIDHSDSLGAAARFGQGDLQWLTAGKGIVHSEMFPLLSREKPNPVELFQIWLNLPAASKMVNPYFSMSWGPKIPRHTHTDAKGHKTEVAIYAGQFGGKSALAAPPDSWASKPASDLAIWTLKMAPGAHVKLPAAKAGSNRTLYMFRGEKLSIGPRSIQSERAARLQPDVEVELVNGNAEAELLLLQGRPIGEPVVQYGPFVMNSPDEIRQTLHDYQRTQFGGWPWKEDGPVHGEVVRRFARHPDGKTEEGA